MTVISSLTQNVYAINGEVLTFPVTIASGESLSDAADFGSGKLVGIIIPGSWTTASLTFSASADGTTFKDLYDDAVERAIPSGSVLADHFIALDYRNWLMVKALKVRSGAAGVPVTQGADRVITLVAIN
ncbi:MAG: hypothetical protein J0I45_16235 [Bosea sp.]|nr:hypothetical protein [Bosea sp. (in: a-proteobacteria)]